VPGGLVRAALLAAMPFYPSRPAAVCAVRAWIVQTVAAWSATVDDARLTSEVARFIRRKTSPITPQGIARLCGVTAKMAVDLRLAVVIPPARKTSLSRRATRMAATLPRIIDIKDAAPWGDPRKRSSWYARHRDQADRQVLALSAILASGDVMKIAIARANVQRAARERALLPSKDRLPVDRLLARLRFRLMARDLGLSHLHHDPADGEIAHGDQTMVWSAKLFTLDYDAALEAALAMTSALSPVPKLQVRILNL
jgi:hypothetical protein